MWDEGAAARARPGTLDAMSAIPPTFRAYVAEKVEGADGVPAVERGIREFAEADLPPGEVEIRVAWSSVNYKDGLATRVDGKVARISPLIPGIDLAGEVVASEDPAIAVGSAVLAHGYDLGVSRHGGYTRVPARAGRLGRAAGAGPDRPRRDGDRDGRVHGRHVRRRARGPRAEPR